MDTKTKLILGAVTLICLLSLVFNCILLGRGKSSTPENNGTAQLQVDSLRSELAARDSLIGLQTAEILEIRSEAEASKGVIAETGKRFESEIADLKEQISKKDEEIKKLKEDARKTAKDTKK